MIVLHLKHKDPQFAPNFVPQGLAHRLRALVKYYNGNEHYNDKMQVAVYFDEDSGDALCPVCEGTLRATVIEEHNNVRAGWVCSSDERPIFSTEFGDYGDTYIPKLSCKLCDLRLDSDQFTFINPHE